MENVHADGHSFHCGLSALDNPGHGNAACYRVSCRQVLPPEGFRVVEQALDFSFIKSETREHIWSVELQKSLVFG
jgi:hypothetical protein